jgi:hypothetical protein
MPYEPSQAVATSARNLFLTCGQCAPGDRVLLVHETEVDGYYDPGLVDELHHAARALGLAVSTHGVRLHRDVRDPDATLRAKMANADCTVFLARLGDQIRYRTQDADSSQIVCYALDREMFASPFAGADYAGFDRLRSLINTAVASAETIRVTCPLGTDFTGTTPAFPSSGADTTRKRFPISIAAPIPASTFQGDIVQSGFLTGTGSHFYTPYACGISDALKVSFKANQITGFDGSARDVDAARAHYAFVSQTYGLDQYHVHSWHAGIHPGLRYRDFAGTSTERWSGGAFGNPRVLHMHTCGDYAPGEISLNVIDATVTLDGVAVWQDGRIYPERIAGGAALLAEHPDLARVFANPEQDVGLASDGRLRLS